MARVKEVVQREMPAGPDEYGSQEAALAAEPHKPIVDARFPTKEKARDAADRINRGEAKRWPKERYFAIFAPNPEPQGETDSEGNVPDAWEVLVAPLSQGIPEGWLKRVNAPGSRKKNREENVNEDSSDEETEDVPVEQEALEPVAA